MAACPCGSCGMQLGWLRKRLAVRALAIKVAVPIVEHVAEIQDRVPVTFKKETASAGEFLASEMLFYAHKGGPRRGYPPSLIDCVPAKGQVLNVPSDGEVVEWRRAASIAAALVNEVDHEWMLQYCAGLSEQDQRLVMQMVQAGGSINSINAYCTRNSGVPR